MMRIRHRGGLAARPARTTAWAAGTAVLTALLVGCTQQPPPSTTVPAPMPAPSTALAAPSGTPSPVSTSTTCPTAPPMWPLPALPAMSPMPAPGHMPAGSTMAAIQQRGYLLAGVDQDSYDWGYPNPSPAASPGESYLGFDIDVLHALAYAIFGDPDAVHFVPVTQDFRMGAANLGIVDVVADSITITCGRAMNVHFSDDYFDAAQELLVPRDAAISVQLDAQHVPHVVGLAGEKVCTVGTTTSAGNLTALAKAGGFSVVLAANWSDCLVLLQQGAVQAFSTDNSILGGILAEDPYLKLAGQPFSFEPHGFAFPQHDPGSPDNAEFISFANGVLRDLELHASGGYCPVPRVAADASCWAALYHKWVDPQVNESTPPPLPPVVSG